MSFISKEIKRFGYIEVNNNQILAAQYHFECDSQTDLPTQTQFQNDKNVFLFMGSTAHTIADNKKWEMQSDGTWVDMTNAPSTYDASDIIYDNTNSGMTATNVQDAVDELNTDLSSKQDTLTFDTTPTQNSTNPVTSGGIWTDQQRQETEIGVVANAGAKNLLKVSVPDAKANAGNTGFTWSGNTASKNHVSFEIKDDLTVYVKSDTGYTASDTTIFYLTDGSDSYPNTILTGCPVGGSSTTYELRTATPVKSDYGSGVEISSGSETNVVIIIRSGWSGELTFKPMIRHAAITDPTFQPYCPTNRELYETCETKVTMQQVCGDAILIPANSDLNNYTTPGKYFTIVANVPTITNTPYNATGFRVVVEKNTPSGAAVFQTLIPTSRSHLAFFKRVFEGGTWSSWYKFEGAEVT